jgi:hypothetical protein
MEGLVSARAMSRVWGLAACRCHSVVGLGGGVVVERAVGAFGGEVVGVEGGHRDEDVDRDEGDGGVVAGGGAIRCSYVTASSATALAGAAARSPLTTSVRRVARSS